MQATNPAMDATWLDIKHSLEVCSNASLPCEGTLQHYHVLLDGRHVMEDDSVLLPARLLASWTSEEPEAPVGRDAKVLVRIPMSVWFCTAKHTSHLRIFRCPLQQDRSLPIVDATWGTAVVISKPMIREDETIQAVELFAGGFCGWGQSIHVLRGQRFPLTTGWMLGNCKECFDSARLVHGGATLVESQDHLRISMRQRTQPIFVLGDIRSDWWLSALEDGKTHVWCASPPCPPWSHAASESGLASEDGALLLRLASLMQACQPVCVCLEQVAGFQSHPHFDFVQGCFGEAGFVKVWEDVVELGDLLPTFRRRYLAAWMRKDLAIPVPRLQEFPMPVKPTLQSAKCTISLPEELLAPCRLSPDVLDLYMEPGLLPLTVRTRRQPAASYRLKAPSQAFPTLMASYHLQHHLPLPLLQSKGLLGCLLDSDQGPRFLSGIEAAFCHGTCRPLFLHRDDKTQMRIQGNCLSVLQATACLTRGLYGLLPPGARPEPTAMQRECLAARIHGG